MKTAVIFESSPFDRKGLFNAVHNRLLHLRSTSQVQMDVYCVHSRDNAFTRAVRRTPATPDVESVYIESIEYKMLWYRFSITDHLILEKLHHHPPQFLKFLKKKVRMLKDYDLVIAHSFTGALFAYAAYLKYGVPYFVTWHGSDIHTHPRRNPIILEDIRVLMKSAECNFFVSKALLAESERIVTGVPKEVLYNGVSDAFVRFSAERRSKLRSKWGMAQDEKVVAFVGNLSTVKNVLVLPEIFKAVSDKYNGPVQFLIAGDGSKCVVGPYNTFVTQAYQCHGQRHVCSGTYAGAVECRLHILLDLPTAVHTTYDVVDTQCCRQSAFHCGQNVISGHRCCNSKACHHHKKHPQTGPKQAPQFLVHMSHLLKIGILSTLHESYRIL